ncbi:MAG: oligosaccharide flippase family protein [Chloroflexi bacterium]|nr:oligosaccharide flippase family protein [Chloroflexota bacterium]
MSPARHMLRGVVHVFLAESLFPLTGIITASFLTRHLGAANYGLFALSATLIGWIELTITSLFGHATIKLVGDAQDWRPVGTTVIRLHLLIGGGVMLLLWLLATPIAALLGEPVLAKEVLLMVVKPPGERSQDRSANHCAGRREGPGDGAKVPHRHLHPGGLP